MSNIVRFIIAIGVTLAFLLGMIIHSTAGELPPTIAKAQRAMVGEAKKGGFACAKPRAFDEQKLVSPDGQITNYVFILNMDEMGCEGFSGSAGSPTQIWTDGEADYVRIFSGYAQGWTLKSGKIIVGLHGSACPGSAGGAMGCELRITWGTDYTKELFLETAPNKWKKIKTFP